MNIILKIALVIVLAIAVVVGGGPIAVDIFHSFHGCEGVSHTPWGEFAYSWNSNNGTLTVRYVRGEPFDQPHLKQLYVEVTDAETGNVANVIWIKGSDRIFVPGEETLSITEAAVDIDLTANDTAQVVRKDEFLWHPDHCHGTHPVHPYPTQRVK